MKAQRLLREIHVKISSYQKCIQEIFYHVIWLASHMASKICCGRINHWHEEDFNLIILTHAWCALYFEIRVILTRTLFIQTIPTRTLSTLDIASVINDKKCKLWCFSTKCFSKQIKCFRMIVSKHWTVVLWHKSVAVNRFWKTTMLLISLFELKQATNILAHARNTTRNTCCVIASTALRCF